MAIAITAVPGTFKFEEVAGNNGAIANSLTLKITGGTFAGDNGGIVDAAITNFPAGLIPVLIKTSATTAKLILTGTATAHANAQDVANLTVTFAEENFATGDGVPDPITNLAVNFNDAAAAKALALVAPDDAGTSETYKAANLPTITGTAPDGVTKVYIYNNGGTKPIGEAAVTANAWTFKLPTEKLKDGVYSLTASASNDGKGAMTAGFAFTVDTKAPAAPSVNAIKGAISDSTPVLTGKAEKFAKVEVFADEAQTKSLGVTFADAKGLWTLAVENTQLVTDGTYKITAKATDAAGNETKTKKAVDLIIDTTIATPTLEATTVAKKNTVALSGKVDGETGGSLQLYGGEDGSLALGKAIKINKDGTWKSSVKLTDGKHLLSVVAIDAAGNMSDNSVLDAADIVTIDTFTATPTVELVKTGEVLTGLKGTAEAGATVKITIGTAKDKFTATADAEGKWVVADVSAFTVTKEAKLKITAIATDAATNVSKASTAVEHTFKVGSGGSTATDILATAAADLKTMVTGAEVFVTKFGSDAVAAVSSTVAFDATDVVADTAQTFSIKLAGVNSGNAITVADLSAATDGATLATALQTALRTADSNATDISVAWTSDVLTITDAKGRAFSEPSLKDNAGTPAELDASITTINGSVAVVAADSFSKVAALDVLTGFAIGTDKVDLQTAAGGVVAVPASLTRVADVATSNDLSAALATAFDSLTANQAGLVVISAGTAAGTYLYADNGNGTVDATADVFIKLVGTTGTLGAVGTLTVGDFFA